jgi:rfaE bifunctional protein nucleotidyltransferase chain/domain
MVKATESRSARKIHSIEEMASIIRDLKSRGYVIVQSHGVFDLLHPGHLHHFEAAKEQGDVLVVTITKDEYVRKGPGNPAFNQRLRAESVAALEVVDYVAINEWPTAVEAIERLNPDVYVKGAEYANSENDLTGMILEEEKAVKAGGGRVHFTDGITFSSSRLMNSHFDVYPEEANCFLQDFRRRYSADDILRRLAQLQNMRVLLVGDTIIDEYHYCEALGKSAKELLVTTRYLNEESFAGGVLAVANHLAEFCGDVEVVTCLGLPDSREEFIRSHLASNVRPTFFYREDAPTVVKRRFVEQAFLSKMFQICFLEDTPLNGGVQEDFCRHLETISPEYDLVIVADFGHGIMTQPSITALQESARFLAVNAQTNSANAGFNLITRYPKADYICLDEPELRLAMHDKFTPVEELIVRLSKTIYSSKVAITRGHRGSVTRDCDEGPFSVPVFSQKVVDRIGAGDAYFAITAPCVAAGFPMELVGFIGNAVGALAVQIVGNRSAVSRPSLLKFITALLK